jgi:hypothetical protein
VYEFNGGEEAALVALRHIAVGECFSVAPSDSENDDGGSEEGSNDDGEGGEVQSDAELDEVV